MSAEVSDEELFRKVSNLDESTLERHRRDLGKRGSMILTTLEPESLRPFHLFETAADSE
jgi:hypothetical protein